MPRLVAELLLFFVPFIAYGLWLWATQRSPWLRDHWQRGPLMWLAIAGLVIVGLSLAALAARERHRPGSEYRPAELRDGQLVPAETR